MHMQEVPRPQVQYRERLLAELASIRPQRTLEVGCGGGGFLRAASRSGYCVEGIDPDPSSISGLLEEGLSVSVGHAEALPHPDGSFDAIVFSYTAHHLADWHQCLGEALRVSRHAVLVLDPWYELGIPSQAVAEEFDRWLKAIDRANGMVHNDCMNAAALLAPVASRLQSYAVHVEYMLELHELGATCLRQDAEAHLRQALQPALWQPTLELIARKAEMLGFSDDGAVLLSLRRQA